MHGIKNEPIRHLGAGPDIGIPAIAGYGQGAAVRGPARHCDAWFGRVWSGRAMQGSKNEPIRHLGAGPDIGIPAIAGYKARRGLARPGDLGRVGAGRGKV